MLDSDLAELYGVTTKRFNEAVKRNVNKFRQDFMFAMVDEEFENLRSQIATSSGKQSKHGGRRYLPNVFTEHGALMAATILNSERAVEVSVYVVRAFVQLRQMAFSHQELAQRLAVLEYKTERLAMQHEKFNDETHENLKQVFDALRGLMTPPELPSKRTIGFI